jgi:DNA-binding MarR family transcriptional regulator
VLNTQAYARLGTVTAARGLDRAEQHAWHEVLWATRLLFDALDRQLKHDAGMPHAYYLILAALSGAPDHTMTMGELARAVRSSPSRLSHAVARMEADGWVRRSRHPHHRRHTYAHLTGAGLRALTAAAPAHLAAVRHHLFDRLTAAQVDALRDACAAVRAGLESAVGASPR